MNDTQNLLLIDDNQAFLATLAEYLRSKGLAVMTADDAASGMQLLEQHPACLVICDFNMPRMNGLQLIRELRKHRQELAVLMLSSQDEPELAQRAIDAGAIDFIPKNCSPKLLVARVRQLLQARGAVILRTARLERWQRLLPSPHRLLALPPASDCEFTQEDLHAGVESP